MENEQKPQGRAKGAVALANQMTDKERKQRAAVAAAARWGKPIKAIRKGSFREELGVDAECYVLDDPNKTPVISQTGLAKVLGMSARGSSFPRFLASQGMAEFVGAELKQKLEKVLIFQWDTGGAGQATITVHGYDAALLIDICQAIIKAHSAGALKPQQSHVASHAATIVGASAKSGIRGLVYALVGYNPSAQEVIEAFKQYVQEEARKYEQEFPVELYMQWHRLYNIPVLERGRSWHFKHLTVRHIYYPLAKSNGKILELLRALKSKDGDRQKKLFMFLNDIGARALRMQIGRVLEMGESSPSKLEYEAKIVERFGGQQELGLVEAILPTVP